MTAARALSAQQKAMPVIGFLGSASPRPVCAVCGRVPTAACAPVVSGIIDRRSTANNTSADDRAALVPHRIEGNAEISRDDPIFKICACWLRRGVHFSPTRWRGGADFPRTT
jgi:hypothetical protein